MCNSFCPLIFTTLRCLRCTEPCVQVASNLYSLCEQSLPHAHREQRAQTYLAFFSCFRMRRIDVVIMASVMTEELLRRKSTCLGANTLQLLQNFGGVQITLPSLAQAPVAQSGRYEGKMHLMLHDTCELRCRFCQRE